MTSTKYHEAVERATFIMQAFYRTIRAEGFDRMSAKQIIETALKCGMINEMFGDGIDKDLLNIKE